MTFYQELQLNQAGSKNLLKKSETVKEKSYHILVYLVKIAVTMAFCFLFDAFGFVLCNYDCMSAFSKPAFTGTWNAVKHCCTGSADSVRMS